MDGNRVLKAVADALQSNCREYDHVARMGGDEFVMILPSSSPEAIADRIRSIKQKVAEIGDGVSIAVGAAVYPVDGTETEDLMVTADMRMYEDKRRHANHPHAQADAATVTRG